MRDATESPFFYLLRLIFGEIKWPVSGGEDILPELTTTFTEMMDEMSKNTGYMRAERVLRMRYFSHPGKVLTYNEVGKCYGVSASRAMELEHRALRWFRNPFRTRKLRLHHTMILELIEK